MPDVVTNYVNKQAQLTLRVAIIMIVAKAVIVIAAIWWLWLQDWQHGIKGVLFMIWEGKP